MAGNRALLFLPDISGFTKFVNETEVDHSQHIIQELIDAMLEANELNMEVAEIEGDAIFFYTEKIPSFDAIHKQIESIFNAFHKQIKLYDTQRICNCGACSGAVDLKLKFILHIGEVGFLKLRGSNTSKPHGKEVVVAHRLLKNKIGHSEYILYSNQFIEHIDSSDARNVLLQNGVMEENELGEIGFKYELIDHWNKNVPEPPAPRKGYLAKSPVEEEIIVNRGLNDIYQFISDFRYRPLWNEDADEILYDESKLNRQGTEHYCIINKDKLDFETVTQEFEHNPYVYGEQLRNSKIFDDFTNYFLLEETQEGKTKVTMQFHIKPKGLLQKLFFPIIKMKLSKKVVQTLEKIREVGEIVDLNKWRKERDQEKVPLEISA